MKFAPARAATSTASLVGVHLPAQGVLGDTWVDMQRPGLYSLYGTNGAGKTTVLRRIAALLSAEASHLRLGEIHLQLRDPSVPCNSTPGLERLMYDALTPMMADYFEIGSPFQDALANAISFALAHASSQPYPDIEWSDDVVVAPVVHQGGSQLPDRVAKAIAQQGRLVLLPDREGGWGVWAGVQLDAATEPLRRIFDEVVAACHIQENEAPPKIVWDGDAYGEMLDAHGTEWVKAILNGHSPPGWAALPVWKIGQIRDRAGLVPRVIEETHGDAHEGTVGALADLVHGWASTDDEGQLDEFGILDVLTSDWSRAASQTCARLLNDCPALELTVGDPLDWEVLLFGRGPRWRARDRWSQEAVRLDQLSRAERRWADMAIQMTVDTLGGVAERESAVVLLDEPELALHRRAERHLVAGLRWFAEQVNGHVLVATHSPTLLGDEETTAIHVRRDDRGLAVCEPIGSLGAFLDVAAESGGLDRTDIVQLTRTFLLVEGAHDKAVLEAVIGDELSDGAIEILKLDGAKNLPQVLSSGLLLRATDARIVVVLDNVDQQSIDTWSEAKKRATAGDSQGALTKLSSLAEAKALEVQMLYELAREAITSHSIDRLTAVGMSKPDIIEYLPPDALGLGGSSWDELKKDWRASAVKDFKKFLRGRGAKISVSSLKQAAATLDTVPSDFIELLETCRPSRPRRPLD